MHHPIQLNVAVNGFLIFEHYTTPTFRCCESYGCFDADKSDNSVISKKKLTDNKRKINYWVEISFESIVYKTTERIILDILFYEQ